MNQPVLEVKNLTKRFGDFTAVDNISFSLSDGEILGLLGPNGAGKTTTIQMLLGVMTPTAGLIRYFGESFTKHREEVLKRINFASTYISFPPLFTVGEILHVFARLYEVPNRKERIEKLLNTFELAHLAKRAYVDLSAGEKTRLTLTKAFLNYPELILLDEPTASLDPEIAINVRRFLKKQKQEFNVSILLTSHNMAEVEELCDKILIVHHGKIIDEGTPEELARKISTCELAFTIADDKDRATKLLTEKEIPFEIERFRFTIPLDERNIAEFLELLAKERVRYEEITIRKPDLEDYFLSVIGEKITS